MKTFAQRKKRSTPARSRSLRYIHHPLGPVQQAQQAEIQRILRSTDAQAKLTVGQPNDKYEQEADRVAGQVMAMPYDRLQRQPQVEEEQEAVQAKSLADRITPLIQREQEPNEEEEIAQAKKDGGPSFSTSVESGVNAIRTGGSPLPESTRSFFEPRFGKDFSGVRIHNDSNANHVARSLNAKAFTTGRDVVFGSGQYAPDSRTGRALLAHELTHVVQQGHSKNARIMRKSYVWPGEERRSSYSIRPLLNLPNMRYTSGRKYGYSRRDATKLYGLNRSPNLVPASGFNREDTNFSDYTKRWTDGLGIARLNQLGGDCGLYARELIRRTGRTPRSYGTSRPGIGLAPADDLRPGQAYYISPRGTGAGGVVQDILSPWNNTVTVRKHLTNFHVATVVAKDNRTVVTSEVNAAFPGRVRPWFAMYRGNRGFYRTFRREYRRGGVDPGLWSM